MKRIADGDAATPAEAARRFRQTCLILDMQKVLTGCVTSNGIQLDAGMKKKALAPALHNCLVGLASRLAVMQDVDPDDELVEAAATVFMKYPRIANMLAKLASVPTPDEEA